MVTKTLRLFSRVNLGDRFRLRNHRMSLHTKILKVDKNSIEFHDGKELPTINDDETMRNLNEAVKVILETDNVVGFPTETVYGLGGSALRDESVKSIYRAKNRPADNPLIVHVSSIAQLERKLLPEGYKISEAYRGLIQKFWPGPLTILLPVHEKSPLSKFVTANQNTFAVRIPCHPVARALIALSDEPLAAPSANASTRPSPTLASHVYNDLKGKIPLILDGGPCGVGVESTVVDGIVSPPMLLRPGGISLEELKEVGGAKWRDIVVAKKTAGKNEAVKTPGMKYKHYSPSAKVVLFNNCEDGISAINDYITKNHITSENIALLRSRKFPEASLINTSIKLDLELGSSGQDISRNLFLGLRRADEEGIDYIFVEGIDETNEGLAVMNRLTKASLEVIDGSK